MKTPTIIITLLVAGDSMNKDAAEVSGSTEGITAKSLETPGNDIIPIAQDKSAVSAVHTAITNRNLQAEWAVSPDQSTVIFATDTYQSILGRDPNELSKNADDIYNAIHPDDRDILSAAHNAATGGEETHYTLRVNPEEEYERTVTATTHPVYEGEDLIAIGTTVIDITDQTEQFQAQFEDFIDSLPDEVFNLDQNLCITQGDAAAASLFNIDTTQETTDHPYFPEYLHANERQRVEETLAHLFTTQQTEVSVETRVKTDAAETRWVSMHAYQYTTVNNTNNIIVFARDITDLKQREQQYQAITDNHPGIVYQSGIDETWPLQQVNGQVETLTGYERSELLNTVEWGTDVIHPEDQEAVTADTIEQLEAKGSFEVTYRIVTKHDKVRWFWERGEKTDENRLEGIMVDITDRELQRKQLERKNDIFHQTEEVANIGAWEYYIDEDSLWWSDQVEEIYGVEEEEFSPTIEDAVSYFSSGVASEIEDALQDAIAGKSGFEITAPFQTEDGEDRWVQVRGEPNIESRNVTSVRGTIQDITEQKRQELLLQELNNSMTQLFDTEAKAESQIAQTAVDIIVDLLDCDIASVCHYMEQQGELEQVAASDLFSEVVGEWSWTADASLPWESYITGETRIADVQTNAEDMEFHPDTDIKSELVIPLDRFGVLVVAETTPNAFDDLTFDLLEILASTTTEALRRNDQTHELRKRNSELELKKNRLDRARDVNEEIRLIARNLTDAATTAEIDKSLCDAVTNIDGFDFAWVGKEDPVNDMVEVSAATGDTDLARKLPRGTTESNTLPAVQVTETKEPVINNSIASNVHGEEWKSVALQQQYRAVASVPIRADGVLHGVLTVYSRESDQFGDIMEEVLTDIGEFAGYVYETTQRQGTFLQAKPTTIALQITEYQSGLMDIADRIGEPVQIDHIAPAANDRLHLYVTIEDGLACEEIKRIIQEDPQLTGVQCVSATDEERLFEVTATEFAAARIAELGGQFQSAVIENEEMIVTVNIPAEMETRDYFDRVEEAVDMNVALHSKNADTTPATAYKAAVLDNLTETQERVLQTAYHSGYFDKKRKRTGQEIADSLDIAQPTFSNRLRAAERNLFTSLYDPDA